MDDEPQLELFLHVSTPVMANFSFGGVPGVQNCHVLTCVPRFMPNGVRLDVSCSCKAR